MSKLIDLIAGVNDQFKFITFFITDAINKAFTK